MEGRSTCPDGGQIDAQELEGHSAWMMLRQLPPSIRTLVSLTLPMTGSTTSGYFPGLGTWLPLSMPGVASGILMVFMPTISTFAISELLTMNNIMETEKVEVQRLAGELGGDMELAIRQLAEGKR